MSSLTSAWTSAGQGVTQVMNRCESAKASGFLDLSDCSLMYVTDAIFLVLKEYDITKCSLKGNDMKKFPKKMVARFPSLQVLNLEGNKIEEVAEEVGDWTDMKGMNLANNAIKALPDGFFKLGGLMLLDLSGNQIQELDPVRFFAAFPALKQLNLQGNPVASRDREAWRKACPDGVGLRLDQ